MIQTSKIQIMFPNRKFERNDSYYVTFTVDLWIKTINIHDYHSVGANLLSNNLTVPSPQPAINSDLPEVSEVKDVTQLSAPVGMSWK